jgi:hypothetical protein
MTDMAKLANQYRQWFGVRRRLQVERILESGANFYEPHFHDGATNPMRILLESYRALLTSVAQGAAYDALDLSELDRGRALLVEEGTRGTGR